MLNKNSIIEAISNYIYDNTAGGDFEADIFADRQELQTFNNEKYSAWFIEITEENRNIVSKEMQEVDSIIDIFYYPEATKDTINLNNLMDILISNLGTCIVTKDYIIDIFDIEPEIMTDNVGRFLRLAIHVKYTDQVREYEKYELMQKLHLNTLDVLHIEKEF